MRRFVYLCLLGVALAAGTASADDAPVAGVEIECPCDLRADGIAWGSRGEYVDCVASEAKEQRRAGSLTRREARGIVRAAKRSTCGVAEAVRCCDFSGVDFNAEVWVGKCRVMTEDECDDLADVVDAFDEGSGSCLPNPCVF